MIRSSCLCGAVRWTADGPWTLMHHCHCSRCRKSAGTAFATLVAAPLASLQIEGDEHVVRWPSTPDMVRTFCGRCGSNTPGDAFGDQIFLPNGNMEGDLDARAGAHIFVASKACWHEVSDDLPQSDAYPEGFDAPVFPDREPPIEPGGVRGSCACQAIAFRFESEPLYSRNCHCQRCRKARSAAYAANLFVPIGSVRFERGEELLRSFKPPEAERFTQAFCATCGSPMPWDVPTRNATMIPMGSLDDDPGIRPTGHIFVDSKAPWFDITDDLPQFPEYPPS